MPTPVGTAPLTVDNRARCSTCSRLQFATVCSRKQCSKCCRDDSRRCGYTGHDSYKAHLLHAAAAPAPIAQDSFALSRPPPVHPPALPFADTSNVPQPPVSALLSSEPTEPWEAATLARRSFRRPMDDSLKADWDQARALRDEKLRGIAMQRESKWKKENSLTLWCWLKDAEPPVRKQIQGIHTFPFYSLVQAPAVLERLGVPEGGRVEAYLDTDEVLSVVPQQTLLFHCVGVTDCLYIDEHIAAAAAGKATTGLPQLGEPQPVQVTIVAPKPLPTPLPPSSSVSLVPSPSPALLTSSSTSTPDDLDTLWQHNQVHVPVSAEGLSWPYGMYVRDMAKGFEFLADVKKNDIAMAFAEVFVGTKWVPATYYSQHAAWRRSTEAEGSCFATTVYQLVRVPTLRRNLLPHQLPRKFHIMFGEVELCAISPSKELMTSEFTRHATTTVFDPAIISLPLNDIPFVYLRRNVCLHEVRSRAEKTSYYVLKSRNRVDICPGTCDFGHIYGPDIDILRYCYHCERWFHARCLDRVCDEHVDELLARDLQWKLPSNPTRTDLLWWFLVSGPAKDHLHTTVPGTPGFEMLVRILIAILEVCHIAVVHLGDQRKWLLSTLVVLVYKSIGIHLCRYMLDIGGTGR
ncbi:hypothetical protein VTO73DRAFT_10249 [Trametes versicolor]